MIQCGTKVIWSNRGYEKQKTEMILAFVPSKVNVFQVDPELQEISKSRRKFDKMESLSSHRYLVEVQRFDKSGKVLESHFYCPFARVIERQNQQAIFNKTMDD